MQAVECRTGKPLLAIEPDTFVAVQAMDFVEAKAQALRSVGRGLGVEDKAPALVRSADLFDCTALSSLGREPLPGESGRATRMRQPWAIVARTRNRLLLRCLPRLPQSPCRVAA